MILYLNNRNETSLHFDKAPGNEVCAYRATHVSQNTNSVTVSMVLLLTIGASFLFHPALPRLFHCSITVSEQAVHPGHLDRR